MLKSLQYLCKFAEEDHLIEIPLTTPLEIVPIGAPILVVDADQRTTGHLVRVYLNGLDTRTATQSWGRPNQIISGRAQMESRTFRKWLVEQGCRIDHGEHQQRHKGSVIVTVHREGRKTEVPLGGSRQLLDARTVRRTCEELRLDPAQLPGPKTRA